MKPTQPLTLTLRPVTRYLTLCGNALALDVGADCLTLDFAPVLRGDPGPPGDLGYDTDLVLIYETAKL